MHGRLSVPSALLAHMNTDAVLIAVVTLAIGLALGWLIGAGLTRAQLAARLAAAETARDLQGSRVEALEADAGIAADLAQMVAPLAQTVTRLEAHVREFERERTDQFARLDGRMAAIAENDIQLQAATQQVLQALHSSGTRGSWAEIHLRRVVEYAGLRDRVDFGTQVNGVNGNGARVRPDMIVRLPEGGIVVIDAKAPLADVAGRDGTAQAKLLRGHVAALAAKEYWSAFPTAPQFTVMFLPNEGILSTALDADASLLEDALGKGVVLATPATLLALLKTIALGWRQQAIGESAQELLALGQELHARLGTMGGHLEKLGSTLGRAVEDYNRLLSSMESRVLISARRMRDLGGYAEEVPEPAPVEAMPRRPSAEELRS
ncbi:hypothetical protein GCM10027079_23690 [Sediminivirga luteola]|uniref:DNA recombination protein RmuC homolog n=2 Tax=Sediminivirga luteola TaxID=1774748 RepID=A0A8J2U1C7_9MICO|nr:hypothetical protein GCM10011333_33850 [Sediminivirga luteola]